MLASFLALDNPWELAPGDLAAKLFPAQVKLVQGSQDVPVALLWAAFARMAGPAGLGPSRL